MTDILHDIRRRRALMRLLLLAVMVNGQWSMVNGQITVGGNVYGGGNKGVVKGNATVTVYAGDLNNVFGGARVADVGGRTFVHVDGEHASDDIFIKAVYGGNDISGTIGQGEAETTIPEELENIWKTADDDNDKTKNKIDTSWKTFIRTSACTTKETKTVPYGESTTEVTADDKLIVIGSLFGGGNGDYEYTDPSPSGGKVYYYVYQLPRTEDDSPIASKVTDSEDTPYNRPELPKTYLEIKGGNIAHVYGGGNNATVTEATVINIDNPSDDLEKASIIYALNNGKTQSEVFEILKSKVKLTTFQSNLASYAFNHARVYGGNNKAPMDIMPTWNLQKGIIRDLYSGGNEGNMTHYKGLLLDIDPIEDNKDLLVINNVYGGCRRADIRPLQADGTPSKSYQIQLPLDMKDNYGNHYKFPEGLSARTLVRGGKITNVYGGNDISGRVFGGNAIGIYTSILGDVYGGGNGSYAYTDKATLGKMDEYKDFYYNIEEVKEKEQEYNPSFDGSQLSSVEALNIFRPNAEQVSLRLAGKDENHPVIIGGSVFVGGNSATLKPRVNTSSSDTEKPLVHLKIGSYVKADKVFLGNNGENMVNADEGGILRTMKETFLDGNGAEQQFNSIDLTVPATFATYMDGCAMTLKPDVVFDFKINENDGDPSSYIPYSSYFGSFYCGGNVGSMKFSGSNTFEFDKKIIIFDKLVGGCNNAYVPEVTGYNAAYDGGVIGNPDDDGTKLVLNLSEVKLMPQRWIVEREPTDYKTKKTDAKENYIYELDSYGNRQLEWNVISASTRKEVNPIIDDETTADLDRRLVGGNVYGGCCESGHVEGNVIVNINGTIVEREGVHGVFDSATPTETALDPEPDPDILYGHDAYSISARRSGVILGEQGMDVLGEALTVFGGGKGKDTEVWGSTTVNITKGYCFQVFGGSESGVIGKPSDSGDYEFNNKSYAYNSDYSTNVNLNCNRPGASRQDDTSENMADVEFIYGGGNQGPIIGDVNVHLDNGRLFNLFAGSCNADILGHTETYVGLNGFPYLRDHIYGGNDLGGEIKGVKDFTSYVSSFALPKVHDGDADNDGVKDVLQASSYIEYRQGHMNSIFGGCFGDYDYIDEFKGYDIPKLNNAFVNIRPVSPISGYTNQVDKVFGGGEGAPGVRDGDKMQNRSYVLIDIPDGMTEYQKTEVFGAGSNNGLGMRFPATMTLADGFNLDKASAIIDLMRGQIGNAYGGSYNEGVTRRSVVNVPVGSTIWMYSDEPDQDVDADGTKTKHLKDYGNIFGGAYGTQILPPCDVYESNVNYRSSDAIVNGSIFGGNNNERRTLYTHVNISAPVWSTEQKAQNGYLGTVYGAGQGKDTWAEYTEVNLERNAQVYEVYGGGMMGHVLNAKSVEKYMLLYTDGPSDEISSKDPYWKDSSKWTVNSQGQRIPNTTELQEKWAADWADAWTLGDYYAPDVDNDNDGVTDSYDYTTYVNNDNTNLVRVRNRQELSDEKDEKIASSLAGKKFNTNVIINKGAYVANYAYGGGYGKKKDALSGDVYGTTYISLLGGTVNKDIYAAGTSGGVYDLFRSKDFTASTNAYIKGGTCRNVYGGGWEGSVGNHAGAISDSPANDIDGETYVVIGNLTGTTFTDGIPAIQRNVYGGGEGGAVYGTTNLTLMNGYIGYDYKNGDYQEKIEDSTQPTPNTLLADAGCIFGGGYVDDSSVDKTHVSIYGGHVRNSAFGGGEIAAVGRGTVAKNTSGGNTVSLHRPGKTHFEMFGGHVHRNVFGGGRGYDNLGRHGTLNDDGYVFGQTEVHVHGGEIGTTAGVENGDGNVFGGGDEGVVYSAYEYEEEVSDGEGGTTTEIKFGKGVKSGVRYNKGLATTDPEYNYQGYYYQHVWEDESQEETYFMHDKVKTDERKFTEDCKVLIEPHAKALEDVTVNGNPYTAGDYVSIEDLNTLQNKNSDSDAGTWSKLDPTGIIIHNAVFAGGNTSGSGSSTGANTVSVYGNATASIHDVFHRDLITLGTGHTGGLYGDGNLTLVDGYRELNITNYGTDYYSIAKEIGIEAFHSLPEREAAYYELKYKCIKDCTDMEGTRYTKGSDSSKPSTLRADDYLTLFDGVEDDGTPLIVTNDKGEKVPNPDYWEENGVLPVYAGRLMNSIQRADFCGVWGSRMVMQGAQDRVPEEVDHNNYTINRVREVSLNKKSYDGDDVVHGNYFGIYNIVNYLGALTSDVDFDDIRVTEATESKYKDDTYGTATGTYYNWKANNIGNRTRNNGNSHNKVALASGVYLELTTEEGTGKGLYEKVWGPITGVVELDLINVSTGIGGGFVYAKNEHGKRTKTNIKNTTLTKLNENAVTKWDYTYDTSDSNKYEWETSGNFVHSTQVIIDDCYNISNRYTGSDAMPAHYWYIKGSVYVYDQYISAYTGLPNAYSEKVEIPLTISAASHGTMKLLNVMPNRYAYYASPGVELANGKKVIINDKEYYKNTPISYWDWYLLSNSEKQLFMPATYVNCITCKIDGVEYAAGTYVMTDTQFNTFKNSSHTYTDTDNEAIQYYDENGNKVTAGTDYIFRMSNNISHDTGYILTYEVNNPEVWNTWYTPKNEDYKNKIDTEAYGLLEPADKTNYDNGPTYRLKVTSGGALLGQRSYQVGELISQNTETTYQAIANKPTNGQATFEPAYILKEKVTVQDGTVTRHLNPGVAVSASQVTTYGISSKVEPAYICTNSVELSTTDFVYRETTMTQSEYERILNNADNQALKDNITANIVPAYYCKVAGLYGGNYYVSGKNYRGLEAWSSMTPAEREQFVFNYDALDLLIDPNYTTASGNAPFSEGRKYQYDGLGYDSEDDVLVTTDENDHIISGNPAGYSITQQIDYTASYNNTAPLELGTSNTISITRNGNIVSDHTIHKDDELGRDVFEALTNEKRHYSPIVVQGAGTYYVVNTEFQVGSSPYAVGSTISSSTFSGLPDTEKGYVTQITFGNDDENKTFYYCREAYEITEDHPVKSIKGAKTGTYTKGSTVPLGAIIGSDNITDGTSTYYGYTNLTNNQADFTIHGISPTETSTLFVSRESNIYDLSKEKIITVIYQYDYEETDGVGNITPISERHVVNIHIEFKNGMPIVDEIEKPDIILPGDFTSLKVPNVIPGASDLMGGGWELYENERDAESHSNGIPYNPTVDPLYWYQHDWYVAYYAKSILGHTYSNHVQVSVANYHDLKEVMEAKEHHYYIDEPNVYRDPKIYIKDYKVVDAQGNETADSQNGLDLLKSLYDLSVLADPAVGTDGLISSGTFEGHKPLGSQVKAGDNLQFFLRSDIDHAGSEWTPIGDDSQCFEGTLHGDGHTISGLDHSLFGKLCGSVYNLGVSGSFTGAGVVDKGDGYVESCWTNTTGTPDGSVYAVFGAPSASTSTTKQMVNCYYQEGKTYKTDASGHGIATPKPDRAFYNGEVAYDLNNFYLYKRYNDNANPGGTTTYNYWKVGEDEPQTGTYAQHEDLCSSGYNGLKYVENRFADGDFIYAEGELPDPHYVDERYKLETVTNTTTGVTKTENHWYPIWPDDYIFFGQSLNYNHVDGRTHQNTPSSINRSNGHISTGTDGNRVYRAPAYFRSSNMKAAYFNPDAVFAQTDKNVAAKIAYKDMTAIDFTGYNDTHEPSGANKSYEMGTTSNGKFYPPLLDDDGLTGFRNVDLTRNLLVYTAAAGSNAIAAEKTATTVGSYLTEPTFAISNPTYLTVAEQPTSTIHGHWVENGEATRDHLLVDKQDFNAPIRFTFASGKRMWYQRKPDNYVDIEWSNATTRSTKGWDAVSLPFKAEIVTTHEKGEITHFYNKYNTKSEDIGHEYWLREFKNGGIQSGEVYKANFKYPDALSADGQKAYTNTFLWDYYYSFNNYDDKNSDKYQEDDSNRDYYKYAHGYDDYPRLAAATPYIIGFPGERYYEFDLSGNFEALTAKDTHPAKLDIMGQTITFASKPGDTTIEVSDNATGVTIDGYTFKPSYLNNPDVETGKHAFLLNSNGDSYEETAAETPNVYAFRPYFLATATTTTQEPDPSRQTTRSIVFSGDGANMSHEANEANDPGTISAHAGKHKIIVTSTLKYTTDVRIVNPAGQVMTTFAIKSGETIETRINNAGVYIVQDEEGKYIKKLAVE